MSKEEKNTAIMVAYEDSDAADIAMPEKNLLLAVLMSAMNDLKRSGVESSRAVEYLLSPDEEYLFSFRSVCSVLSVDPEKVLRVIGLQGDGSNSGVTDSSLEKENSLRL